MRDELVALADLAKMDDSVRHIDAELKQLPERLTELRASVQTLETLLAQEREQLTQAEALKGTQSLELQERGQGLARARRNAAHASNAKEANAGEREIEANRRAIKEREDELKRIGEAIEAKTASLAERETDFQGAQELLQSEEANSKARIDELSSERGKHLGGRDDLIEKLPKMIVKRYDRLRTGMVSAVSVVAGGACTACRMKIPAQLYIDLQRAEEIHQCPHCRRLMVLQEQANEPVEVTATFE